MDHSFPPLHGLGAGEAAGIGNLTDFPDLGHDDWLSPAVNGTDLAGGQETLWHGIRANAAEPHLILPRASAQPSHSFTASPTTPLRWDASFVRAAVCPAVAMAPNRIASSLAISATVTIVFSVSSTQPGHSRQMF
jgi:hypothetical protein